MSVYIIIWILFCHWVSDFILQTHWQASNKSKNVRALINHTFNYSLLMLIGVSLSLYSPGQIHFKQSVDDCLFVFWGITFITHTFIDYFTSRLNAKLWEKKQVHNFFVSVGFDQLLHFVQLILTYKFLLG